MRLLQHPNFVKEYTEFSEKISKITNPDHKKELEQLLSNLVSAVKSIDKHHEEAILNRKSVSMDTSKKDEITDLRRRIKNALI